MADYFFGIDVSKRTLDIALVKDNQILHQEKIGNTGSELEAFFRGCFARFGIGQGQALVCMEHTGIYNNVALVSLPKLSLTICLEPALQIKRSIGMVRGKCDRVDAERIARYAYKNREELHPWQPSRACVQKLKHLLSVRENILRARNQVEVPMRESAGFVDAGVVKTIAKNLAPVLKGFERSLKKLEKEIKELVSSDGQLSVQLKRATSVPGIGWISAMHMIVESGEFKKIKCPKKFACHAAVAPFKEESGTSVKKRVRVSKMGNMNLKRILHLAALSAVRCPGELRDYFERKVSEGKNKMSVLNAVRNKLITRVFVCITQQRTYEKNYQTCIV